jgi:hypothetical protein
MSRICSRLSYANVVATLAPFIALGGGAYAAIKLPANSVGTKQLKKKGRHRRQDREQRRDVSEGQGRLAARAGLQSGPASGRTGRATRATRETLGRPVLAVRRASRRAASARRMSASALATGPRSQPPATPASAPLVAATPAAPGSTRLSVGQRRPAEVPRAGLCCLRTTTTGPPLLV